MAAVMKQPASAPRTVIIGLGKTGLSCARFLAARDVPLAVTDSRAQPPGLTYLQQELPQVALFMEGFNTEILTRAEQIVVSPGVSLKEPIITEAMKRGIPVLGDIELFARYTRAPVIAITGSNGKSTVTTLVGLMAQCAGLEVRVGGNLGTPALDLVQDCEPDLYVLELSSFQLETTHSLNAAAAVVLNITPDHMDRYADIDEYIRAKARAYNGDGVMVINVDDPTVNAMICPDRRLVRFGLAAPAPDGFGLRSECGETCLARGGQSLLPVRELRIKGSHNIANALAALALGDALNLPLAAMLKALREFPGLPHRSQWVAERDGINWYNDSKGTNVGATLAALQGLATSADSNHGKVVLIAGGDGKGADFTPLRTAVADHARAVVLIGRDAPIIEAALNNIVPVVHARNMQEAVGAARNLAQRGDQVLLSPACASFDMYSGYEERGRMFVVAVEKSLKLPGEALQ
ncbi:MAG: UDP-N-acetylmuramoyl-L-alanine--D-glutamate ligase [Gammaproteobacteria bacterium]